MVKNFDKFDKMNENNDGFQNNLPYKKEYPFICEYKNRTPSPGQCYVTEINFEDRKLKCNNGNYRYSPSFDEIIVKRFIITANDETIYTQVSFTD